MVLDRRTGRLAGQPTIESLADALHALLREDGGPSALARQAIEHARHQFSRQRYAAEYLEVYRRLLA